MIKQGCQRILINLSSENGLRRDFQFDSKQIKVIESLSTNSWNYWFNLRFKPRPRLACSLWYLIESWNNSPNDVSQIKIPTMTARKIWKWDEIFEVTTDLLWFEIIFLACFSRINFYYYRRIYILRIFTFHLKCLNGRRNSNSLFFVVLSAPQLQDVVI